MAINDATELFLMTPILLGSHNDEPLSWNSKRWRRLYPLLRGGVATPIKQMQRYLSLGVAGEVKRKPLPTSPRCALF